MSAQPITPAEINRRNSEFWEKEGREMVRRGADGTLLKHALMDIQSEQRRGVPVHNQKILEEALQDAEARRQDLEPDIRRDLELQYGGILNLKYGRNLSLKSAAKPAVSRLASPGALRRRIGCRSGSSHWCERTPR